MDDPVLTTAVLHELRRRFTALDEAAPLTAGALEEPLGELLVELVGLHVAATHAAHEPSSGAVSDVLAELRHVLLEDLAARVGVLAWPGALPRAAELLPCLLDPSLFAAVLATAERTLPEAPRPRLQEPVDTIRESCTALRAVFAREWRETPPVVAVAGGPELVVRLARVQVAAALVRNATEDPDDLTETTARRYAWRWLRDPAPEAASVQHRKRTAALLRRWCVDAADAILGEVV